jgi:magnesium-transporting ATPase (P-type)
MTDEMKGNLNHVINEYAKGALRTICFGYKDLLPNEHGPEHDQP